MAPSKKRASPGAGNADESLATEDELKMLLDLQREEEKFELFHEFQVQELVKPLMQKRREALKTIKNFWLHTFQRHPTLNMHLAHKEDLLALGELEDVWVERHPLEPRAFTVELHFKENPFFSDKVLKKEYKPVHVPAAKPTSPADITDEQLEFNAESLEPQSIKINWKSEAKNLTKVHPRVQDPDGDDELPVEPGSFFTFFEHAADPFELGSLIATDVFVNAINYFTGQVDEDAIDSEEEEDSEDDEDEEEIDLEKPRKKKQKA